ncbi:MAG: hypothetical protein KAG99_00540 [Bacteroidales bacterium]|nr:hypothetical protein [Bacteroidales bacterium]
MDSSFETWFLFGIMIVLSAAILLSFFRFIKGPKTSDRVVAMDTLTITIVAFLILVAYTSGRYIYVDVSLVYAVVGFIGVIAFARYLEGGV